MKGLITYFKPFNECLENYSKILVEKVQLDIQKVELNVEYDNDAKKLIEIFKQSKFDYLILTGEARSRTRLSLEARAKNLNSAPLKDNAGILIENKKIKDNGEDYLYATADLDKILDLLDKDLVYKSEDAGSFVCNNLYYLMLDYLKDKNVPTLFIHVPKVEEDDIPRYTKQIEKIILIMEELYGKK